MEKHIIDQTLKSVEAVQSQEEKSEEIDAYSGVVWLDIDDEPENPPDLWRTSSRFPMDECTDDEEDSASEESEEDSESEQEEEENTLELVIPMWFMNGDAHQWIHSIYRDFGGTLRYCEENVAWENRARYRPGSWNYTPAQGWFNGPHVLPPDYPPTGVYSAYFNHSLLTFVKYSLEEICGATFPVFRGFIGEDERVAHDWLGLPLSRRPMACVFRDIFPIFHRPDSLKHEIRDELQSVVNQLLTQFLGTDMMKIIALYFAGVDFGFYFQSTFTKSARPYGLNGGIQKKKPNRRGTRGSKKNAAINKSLKDGFAKEHGKRDGDEEVKKERALPQCFICKEFGHKKFDCPLSPTCDTCGKRGHEAHSCRSAPSPKIEKAEDVPPVEPVEPARPPPPCTEIVVHSTHDTIDATGWPDRSKREKLGIVFYTRTNFFYSVDRRWSVTPIGRACRLTRMVEVANTTYAAAPRLGLGWLDVMFARIVTRAVQGLFTRAEEARVVHRIGGLKHEIGLDHEPYDSEDSRSDYLAVGDVKHSNPLYCSYRVTHQTIPLSFVIASQVQGFLYRWGVLNTIRGPLRDEIPVDKLDAMPRSLVSKELFYNNANSRIGPHVSDDSAVNTISMSLAKSPLINLSRKFIEENDCASGGSDEAVIRTREALLDFRTHLKEEQVNRYLNKEVRTDSERYIPGIMAGQPAFEADWEDALN